MTTGAIFCTQCGRGLQPGAGFCANCGTRTSGAVALGDGPGATTVQGRDWSGKAFAMVAAGVGLIIAPFLPAISATAALVGSLERSAIDMTSGEALVLCVIGVGVIYGAWLAASRRPGGRLGLTIVGLIALAYSIYLYVQIDERVREVTSEAAFASVGMGVYVAIAASIVVILAGLNRGGAQSLAAAS